MSQESIKTLLDKINLLFNVFMKDGLDKVSSLEKELLKEQIQKLLAELDKIETSSQEIEISFSAKEVIEPPQESFTVPAQKTQEIELEKEVAESEIVPEEGAIQAFELPVEEETLEVLQEEAVKEVDSPIEEEAVLPVVETPSIAKQDDRVFNESKPTRSLREIIDLNKSFILKAELFENKHEDYALFISDLNSLQSEEASVKLVESKAKELSWDTEDKAYELLIRAVEKRFLPLLQQ